MRRKSKNIMAILLAASMMTGLCSVPVAAAEEIIAEEQVAELDSGEQETVLTGEEGTESEDGGASLENSAVDEDVEISEEPDSEEDTDEIEVSEDTDEEELPAAEEAAEYGFEVFSDGSDAQSEDYGVFVGGYRVTSENKDDIFGDGKKAATYNPATNTLTLKDADIIGDIWFDTEDTDAVLELTGKNTIREDNSPRAARPRNFPAGQIYAERNLTIKGSGSLETKVDENGEILSCYKRLIGAMQNIVIEGVTLNLSMEDTQSGIVANGNVILQNKANVTLHLGEEGEDSAISAIDADLLEVTGSTLILPDRGLDNGGTEYKMDVSITDSTVDAKHIRVRDITVKNSEVTLESKYAPAISVDDGTKKKLEISDSKVKATATENLRSDFVYVIDSYNDIEITNSVVIVSGSEEKSVHSIIAADEDTKNLTITNSWVDCDTEADADVTVKDSVLFSGTTGKVSGNAVVPRTAEVVSGKALNVPESATLTIPSGITVKNNGAINAYCNTIKGTITGTGPVITHGKLTGWLKDSKTHWKECNRCKTKFESAGHSYTEWKVTEKAGLGKSGSKERTCSVCGYVQKSQIAAVKVMTLGVKGGKKSVALKWSKVSGADGYMIYGAKCGKNYRYTLKKTVKKNVTSWTDKKLQTGKYYKYYVVAYKMVNGEKTIIGETGDMHTATLGRGYGYANKITVQKSSLKLKKGKTARIRVSITDTNDKVLQHVARVRYVSTNVKVATVNGKGKVRAVSKGKCYVYCYSMNGLVKKVKVTVK